MVFHLPPRQTLGILGIAGLVILTITLVNPVSNFNALLFLIYLLVIGHLVLQEKLLLVFLGVRPTLDYWRDVILFRYEDSPINLTAAFSLLLLAWSVVMIIKYRKDLPSIPLLIPVSLFTVFLFGTALWSIAPAATLIESIKWLNLAGLFGLTFIFAKQKKILPPALIGTIVASAIIPIIVALLQLIGGTGITTFGIHGRIYGTLAHPNVFAFLLLTIIILVIQYTVVSPQHLSTPAPEHISPLYRNLSLGILITLLLFTYTRAAFIGLLIFIIGISTYRYKKLGMGLIIGIGLFYLIFFPINAWLTDSFNVNLEGIPLIGRITATNDEADSFAWRQSLLRETIPIIRSRPFFGFGYGTFAKVWTENQNAIHDWDDSSEAHNDYLRLALETGLIGLVLYLVVLTQLIGKIIPLAREWPGRYLHLLCFVIVFAIMSVSDNMLRHTPVMWLMWSYWGGVLGTKS